MDLLEAINIRRSRRTYGALPLQEIAQKALQKSIERYNAHSNLHIQLIVQDTAAFAKLTKTYGMFSGVRNYIALVGKKNDPYFAEKSGYYGEKLVLEATALGLDTCWVGATFDKKSCACAVAEDESFTCVIAIGSAAIKVSVKEKFLSNLMHRKTKRLDELYESNTEVPQWFLDAMNAVQKAPSAVNKQPVLFHYDTNKISASVRDPSGYENIDLGIAKLHFEIAAACYVNGGSWDWGNGALFSYRK